MNVKFYKKKVKVNFKFTKCYNAIKKHFLIVQLFLPIISIILLKKFSNKIFLLTFGWIKFGASAEQCTKTKSTDNKPWNPKY